MTNETEETSGLFGRVWSFISDEPSLAISLGYLLLIGIGMLFSYQYYANWGIDVFQFAGFEDFLLAPFKDMLVLFFVPVSVLISYLAIRFSKKLDRKYPRLSKYWNFGITAESKNYNQFMNFHLFAGILLYLHISSSIFSAYREYRVRKHPENYRVNVQLEDGSFQPYLLLGLTENFVLVLSEKERQAIAIPTEGGKVKGIFFSAGSR